ncbi:hypothetical protein FA95DRAFT_1555314 [Auriscalpium vulgare]|uniref:Uncharacterized protein n=1 Tax=Auriscalpium vulgare TaxID=40419 RepID=A0ACB8S2Z4_9AGAM|nr:hypothetical protein FA95DRAFT_1555314 [Auriscalpium vulgare]
MVSSQRTATFSVCLPGAGALEKPATRLTMTTRSTREEKTEEERGAGNACNNYVGRLDFNRVSRSVHKLLNHARRGGRRRLE